MISAWRQLWRAAMLATGIQGGLTTVIVAPFTNDYVPNAELADGDVSCGLAGLFTAGSATFDIITGTVAGIDEVGQQILEVMGGYSDTIGTSSVASNIYGYAIFAGIGFTSIVYAARFDNPIPIGFDGQLVAFPVKLSLANECGGS